VVAWIGFLILLAGCGGGGGGGGTGGSGGGSTLPPLDTTPNAFSFPEKTAVARSELLTSSEILITGINASASVSITGGEYSIDGDGFRSAAGTVTNNQTIRVRLTPSSEFSTSTSAVLTVGGVSATFTVTTEARDATPDEFEFQPQVDVSRGTWVVSNVVTIEGLNDAVAINVENGEYSIDDGVFTTAAGTIQAGHTVKLRAQASSNYSMATPARVTIGDGMPVSFEVISEVPDYVPSQVVFDGTDVVYLLDGANKLILRWSIERERYLGAYALSDIPALIAYSSEHRRLYLGYASGEIRYIDATTDEGVQVAFASTPLGVQGLAAVGKYLLAQDLTGAWATHYIFDGSGSLTDQAEYNYYSREYAWDPGTSRVYFFRDNMSPDDLHYEVIDQVTGEISASGETPYHGSYNIQPPIRVSSGGQYVLLGSGDIYSQPALTWSGSLGSQVTDARWFVDGSLVTLTTTGSQTTLRRLNPELRSVEQLNYQGQALRVVGADAKMAVLVADGGTARFHIYVPSNDSDGDGVDNTLDAFPLDAAASLDTDHDGYPDAWNTGKAGSDSTTGLTLDAYPQDSACYLSAHGDGVHCDYGATVPGFVPDQIVSDGDTIYLLSSINKRVYRWSIADGVYVNPYIVGIDQGFTTLSPKLMAYSADQHRLYLAYDSGAIQYIDVTSGSGSEVHFGNVATSVGGLAAVGKYVMVQDFSGAWATHYVFDRNGAITDQAEWNYYSREYAWDPMTSRVYFFRDDTSPDDLHYEVIDQITGEISASGETPYHGSYNIQPPIRVSSGGQYVLLGSGDIYNQFGLTWSGSIGMQVADARWFADDSLVTLTTAGGKTVLRRLGVDLANLEQLNFDGQALRVVGTDAKMIVVVTDGSAVQFHSYVPNNDSDGDGVDNTLDAFPLDAAASLDTDHDAYPDAWNAGASQADSTTGLTLDAYPADAACYLPEHGDGVNCNYGSTIPAVYVPDQVINDGDTVYLLSSANHRVYRWSIATGTYLNPYVVGIDQGFSTIAPTTMAFSGEHHRLYLGYSTGAIQYIDVSGAELAMPFGNTAMAVAGLASVGDYVLAQDASGAWATHYVFDRNGAITDQVEWNYHSREYAWDPVTSRVYFFRDDSSPNDLHYEVIDQSTGKIVLAGETPYHGDYSIQPPIRVSADGQLILLGSGDIYQQPGLAHVAALGKSIADAAWRDGMLVDLDTNDQVEIRDPDSLDVIANYPYVGQPIRMVFGQSDAYLVHVVGGATKFLKLAFGDQDADTLPEWWEQLYGLSDAAATDALDDPDADGVSNADEYLHRANPVLADTDADGLTDYEEIVTYSTNPARIDSDGDGLDDVDEVTTYHSDPLTVDSDGDGYSDFIEVEHGGDPNDVAVLPQPLMNYSQTFEGTPDLTAWITPPYSSGSSSVDTAEAHSGTASLRIGTVSAAESSSIRFRSFFSAGTLSFHAKFDSSYCCESLDVLVDGAVVWSLTAMFANDQWIQRSTVLTLGVHDIEWRYQRDSAGDPGAAAVWIDDVTFVKQ